MLKSIDVPSLQQWKANYAAPQNKAMDTMTESAVVSLELLERFLNEAKTNSPGFNGVRIYFIRYDKPNDKLTPNNAYGNGNEMYKYVSEIGNSGLSQLSLAFVPVKDFDPVTLAGKDFVQPANNKIHTLAICHPADWPTGLIEEGVLQTGTTQEQTGAWYTGTQTTAVPMDAMEMETIERGTGLCPPKCKG